MNLILYREKARGNIMWDKRVVRGNTHSAMLTSAHMDTEKLKGTMNRSKKV